MIHKLREKPPEKVWEAFKEEQRLTDEQLELFQRYEALLSEWNRSINLTAVNGLSHIVSRHFADSLALRNHLDLSKVSLVADIGSGAGFPGIPLKIMFPNLEVILIEVTKKRQKFLRALIQELGLQNVEICDMDWRTFLRKTEANIEYFLTRASLDTIELIRMFRPGCSYKNAKLIYWAAGDWEPELAVKPFVYEQKEYVLKRKHRKLVFMGLKKKS